MYQVINNNHESIRLDKSSCFGTQHKQEAAMAEMDQLTSMPLSQLAMDDSGPLMVQYDTYAPIAASTPTGTDEHAHSSQHEDSYQQIIQLGSEAVASNHFAIKCQKA